MTDFEKDLKRMDAGFACFVKKYKKQLERERRHREETNRKLMEIINDPENKDLLGGVQ